MNKGIAIIFIALTTLSVILTACTPENKNIDQNVNTQPITPSKENINLILKECELQQSAGSKAFIGSIFTVNEDCLFKKADSVQTCKEYLGKTIYNGVGRTVNFKSDDVNKCIKFLATEKNETSFCDELNPKDPRCYYQIAINTKNPTICKNQSINIIECYKFYISSLDINTLCRAKTGYFVGLLSCIYDQLEINKENINTNDLSICSFFDSFESFSEEDKKEGCIAAVGVYLKDTSICNQASKYKGDCWIEIARDTPTFTLRDCDRAGVEYIGCYKAVAVAKNDSSICLNLPQGHKTDCLRQIVLKTNNVDTCLQIDEPQYSKNCVQTVFSRIKHEEYTFALCEKIAKFGEDLRPNQCFYDVALKNLDLEACNRIQGEDTTKSECVTRVQHALANK